MIRFIFSRHLSHLQICVHITKLVDFDARRALYACQYVNVNLLMNPIYNRRVLLMLERVFARRSQ